MNEFETFETLSIHAGEEPDPQTGAMRLPLHMASTFKLPSFGPKLIDALLLQSPHPAHVYTRWSNPTLRALEERLVALETSGIKKSAEPVDALVTASGMAAVSSLLLTFLGSGDHVIAPAVCYHATIESFGMLLPRLGIEVSLVNTGDLDQVRAALKPNTKLIYAETPANPIVALTDIAALAEIAHESGALLAVDSTWASPALQKPLALGADYVIHSLTKYINGHGDALGGVVIGPQSGVHRIRKEGLIPLGGALSPFNAWQIMRGLATLPVRMKQVCQNAMQIAEFLEAHPKVKRVVYPGLLSHPHHELAKKQMSGFSGMMTIQLKGGLGAAINLSEKIKLFTYATSLGMAQSLVYYYPTDIYVDAAAYLSMEQKAFFRAWAGDGIIRASIGLENVDDLIADLDQALSVRTFKGALGPLAYRLLKKVNHS